MYLDYYRARRCILALADGASGQAVWRQPMIVQDLIDTIREVSGLRVEPKPALS
jgi:hypothetical protein